MKKMIAFFFSLCLISLWSLSLGAQIQSPLDTRDVSPSKPLPPLMATAQEVNQFFVEFVRQYEERDIDGFLSLFSSKAIQNQKDPPERIREIYTNFFNQSLSLRFQVREMKTEIYQNAVEVKAHYEIDQVFNKKGESRTWEGKIRWVLVKEDGALKVLSLDYQYQKGGGQ